MLRELLDKWWGAIAGLAFIAVILVATVVYPAWKSAVDRNRDARADPHHIAGNLYFVGAPDVTSFLITAPEGDVLIGGGWENSAHKIIDNIAQLGFDIRNVRALIASGGHLDDAGGLAELQRASGAQLWAGENVADAIASGGGATASVSDIEDKWLAWAHITRYPAARVDHRVKAGETIHVGSLAFTAHITTNALDCTTWTFIVRERNPAIAPGTPRELHVVHRCNLGVRANPSHSEAERYANRRADFERGFDDLRQLPVDIWLTPQGRDYGRFRKYDASLHATDPVAPFIDPEGYRKSIDDAEDTLHKVIAERQQRR
ncbi:MAG TPA: MBL fold metallo-hydrolase [Vicinamibacterales bacterium]|nr:MBL fold metallo-hydrolase [Vicinamibacterales bacterium]